jgi:hypothetical protein
MIKVKNIKSQQDLILTEFNELLQQISESLGLDCKIHDLRVQSGNEADLRISLKLMSGENGQATPVTTYEFQWERKCAKHNLDPSCLHKVYIMTLPRMRSSSYEILGI